MDDYNTVRNMYALHKHCGDLDLLLKAIMRELTEEMIVLCSLFQMSNSGRAYLDSRIQFCWNSINHSLCIFDLENTAKRLGAQMAGTCSSMQYDLFFISSPMQIGMI